jgi:Cdc6-like AAA superfamily ATPase
MAENLNPFIPQFGSYPPDLIGRDRIVENYIKAINSKQGNPLKTSIFVGMRGTGKTALLYDIANHAVQNGFITARVTSSNNMLEEIIQLLQINGQHLVTTTKSQVSSINVGGLGFSVGLTFNQTTEENFGFRVKLEMITKRLNAIGVGVLILVDEVQAVNDNMRTLATTYQNMLGEGYNISVVMAGLPSKISTVINDKILTFLYRAHRETLGLLDLSIVERELKKIIEKNGKIISTEALHRATIASRGYPYLIQLVGYNMWENSDDNQEISLADVELSETQSTRDIINSVLMPVLNDMSKKDRVFLEAIANSDDKRVEISELEESLQKSASWVQQYKYRLIDSGVIASPSRGIVEIETPYLREYLRGELK